VEHQGSKAQESKAQDAKAPRQMKSQDADAQDLNGLFVHMLKDIYFAESAILKALPKMAAAAKSPALKKAFEAHLKQTEGQIKRLDQVFKLCGQKPEAIPCEAIKGLLKEGDEIAEMFKGGAALDAGLIAAAQAVEHYEMARYGSLCAWANELGIDGAAKLLEATLVEEKSTDLALTSLAQETVNMAAMAA
jgi:ferritin-like metal-binding protein YciE